MKSLVFLEHHGGELTKGSLGVLAKAVALGGDDVAAVLVGGADVGALASEVGKFGAAVGVRRGRRRAGSAAAATARRRHRAGRARAGLRHRAVRELRARGRCRGRARGATRGRSQLGPRRPRGTRRRAGREASRAPGLRARRRGVAVTGAARVVPHRIVRRRGHGRRRTRRDPRTFELQDHSRGATIVSQRPAESEGPSIEDADVIVAGGIGLGAAENFALAETLAEILGGAVGATRAVVYKGWYPHSAQVGQTGKTVTPKLYVALGISGAVQHKVGMQNSKVIVAINKDPERADLRVQRPRGRRRRAHDRARARRAPAATQELVSDAPGRLPAAVHGRASSSPSRPTRSTSASRSVS